MRVSIATCQDRVCPRFDRAATLIVIDVRGAREENREVVDISAWPARGRAARLEQLGIHQLICGALSSFDAAGFDESPVRLVPRVAGPVGAVIHAVLSGTISPGRDYWQDHSDARSRQRRRLREAQESKQAKCEHGTVKEGHNGLDTKKG